MTFNDYIWQVCPLPLPPYFCTDDHPQHRKPLDITRRAVLSYAFRFLFAMLTMEFILHFMYVVAMKDTKAWAGDTPAEIGMIGFWNLIIVWLKVSYSLLVLQPWQFSNHIFLRSS